MRCFEGRRDGFYIDIGSGHPVYDNTSFAFYLAGWRGVTVEPNPWLAALTRAVRPRDHHVEALVGATPGEATFYLVDEFHGLSTMIEAHARAAQAQFGKTSRPIATAVTTLRELCERHAPRAFDFHPSRAPRRGSVLMSELHQQGVHRVIQPVNRCR